MTKAKTLEAVHTHTHTHTHTSNFIENKKAEKAFVKDRKKMDYDLLVASFKNWVNKK